MVQKLLSYKFVHFICNTPYSQKNEEKAQQCARDNGKVKPTQSSTFLLN